jgi:phage-related holin
MTDAVPPPKAGRVATAWTQPLKWSFLGLQVAGVYLAGTVLLVLAVAAFILFSLIATLLGQTHTSYLDFARVVLFELSQQPLVFAGIVAAILASILTTRGAVRRKAWAHWAAMALIAASIVPAILMAVTFRDWVWWLVALPYSAACVAFLAAMTYAAIRYGPWGVIPHRADALPPG